MIFQQVTFEWEGKRCTIPADRILPVIAQVEEVITLPELVAASVGRRMPIAKIAMAFGIALRGAGVQVTDDEVYNGMFAAHGAELIQRGRMAVIALQTMMIPPEHLRKPEAAASAGKGSAAGRGAGSSRTRTGSRSGKAG